MGSISLTALRSNLFKIVDEIIKTGNPVEIERNGHRLKIILEEKRSKLDNLKPHDCIVGDPNDLIQITVGEWGEPTKL
ncbi:MAG: type II toxin-antitoxin system Phd/YefM family antitoxin [Deltaproteobacteria bacterium]|nr:type II toxin-antitoxin system Phd/YefM family antitoxin [Deltaproteobacteria bacterium]MBW2078441.1 type II toxin-antitoxin system Phd/YefM family antitoxin [Deltaproteobacteria bacterium]RLB28556.1 MAG: type II toxin-antitoxin system Phd/YefM family antitoxin [Deltaproteobacteria bacterium]